MSDRTKDQGARRQHRRPRHAAISVVQPELGASGKPTGVYLVNAGEGIYFQGTRIEIALTVTS